MLDRTIAPPFQNDYSLRLLAPQTFRLGNGAIAHFINGGTQEVLKIELVFPAGRWFEHIPGLAYLTSNLLSKGTTKNNSNQIAECFDFYGAHLEVEASFDFVSLSLYTLTHNVAPTLDLLLELAINPTFPEKEVEQFKSTYIQNLKVNNQKTNYLASKEIRKMIFGNTHPYGVEVTVEDVSSFANAEFANYHKKQFVNPIVFVSGSYSEKQAEFINRSIEKIKGYDALPLQLEKSEIAPFQNRIEKKDSVQSSLRMGKKTIGPAHADYPKAMFVNHLLGGYFGSRLMKNIREEKGLTYGIYSSIHALQQDCMLTIGADVNSENRELVFDEIKKEIVKLQTEPVSETELKTASAHFIGSLQADISTPFAHADKQKNILLKGLPADHYQHTIDVIASMDSSEVMATAKTYFDTASFFEVAVG